MRLVAEQGGIFLDQLGRVFRLELTQTVEFAFEMRRREWLGTEQLTPETLPCVWLRQPGMPYVGGGWEGRRPRRPHKDDVPYLWAVNEARLHFVRSRAGGRWICHADLLRDFRATQFDCVPAAVVEYPDGDGVLIRRAIEVGWRRGQGAWDPSVEAAFVENTLDTLTTRYDEVEFFCGGAMHVFAEKEALVEEYDSLVLRELVPPREAPVVDHPFMVTLKSQAKIGKAAEGPGAIPRPLRSAPGKRALPIKNPCVVYEIPRSGLPVEGREAIGETIGRSKLPSLRRVFCTVTGTKIYCAETAIGDFRITKSRYGWRADEVLEDWVFVKKLARDPSSQVPVKPFLVDPIDIEQMPEEVREALVEAKGIEELSRITAVWHKCSGKRDAYCVETTKGLYFVVLIPQWGWTAEIIDPELVLVRQGGPALPDCPNVVEPPRFEIDEKLWRKVAPLLPDLSQDKRRKMSVKYSNRAVLSGIIYRLRSGVGWHSIPTELGFGDGGGIRRRLLSWHSEGRWGAVQELLEEELKDGRRLNWDDLELSA
jgi:transposase